MQDSLKYACAQFGLNDWTKNKEMVKGAGRGVLFNLQKVQPL